MQTVSLADPVMKSTTSFGGVSYAGSSQYDDGSHLGDESHLGDGSHLGDTRHIPDVLPLEKVCHILEAIALKAHIEAERGSHARILNT